jgi:hypothetical protein
VSLAQKNNPIICISKKKKACSDLRTKIGKVHPKTDHEGPEQV